MVLCERMGPKIYKYDEVRNPDNKTLSKIEFVLYEKE